MEVPLDLDIRGAGRYSSLVVIAMATACICCCPGAREAAMAEVLLATMMLH